MVECWHEGLQGLIWIPSFPANDGAADLAVAMDTE